MRFYMKLCYGLLIPLKEDSRKVLQVTAIWQGITFHNKKIQLVNKFIYLHICHFIYLLIHVLPDKCNHSTCIYVIEKFYASDYLI